MTVIENLGQMSPRAWYLTRHGQILKKQQALLDNQYCRDRNLRSTDSRQHGGFLFHQRPRLAITDQPSARVRRDTELKSPPASRAALTTRSPSRIPARASIDLILVQSPVDGVTPFPGSLIKAARQISRYITQQEGE
ncbi:hypothetical protein [Sphingobium sp. YR657]|uniref:hypothetical protein n=1 Tax=Sphingobium sp. YR657 TaxID=1884366 RepID=UPI003137E039